jgi:hypothetical protein
MIAKGCSDDCGSGTAASNDGCDLVEGGLYKSTISGLKVPPPAMLARVCFLWVEFAPLALVAEPAILPDKSFDRPLDWVTAWNFVRRTAPFSRAPSLLCA